jgi:transcriptional regulator with XRE-family HTH domain
MQALSFTQLERSGNGAKKRAMSGPESNLEIGRRLRWTRIALELNQAELARSLSDDPGFAQVWNNWERGRDRPSLDNAMLLVRKYRVSLDWIFHGDDGNLPAKLARGIDKARLADASPVKAAPKRA